MKRKGIHILLCMLLVLMMIPAAAFAADGHKVDGDLDLTSGDHSGKTLDGDGYTWNESTHTLTMQDLTVTGEINLPNVDCQIDVKGVCSVLTISNSTGGRAVTITGETDASFSGQIMVSGNLTLTNLTMTDGTVQNSSGNPDFVLQLNDSNINLNHLFWGADGGINLEKSQLKVSPKLEEVAQFWVEKIAMDDMSRIESKIEMSNHGMCELAEQSVYDSYIVEPTNGHFAKVRPSETAADTYLTIVNKDGNIADHFILQAPEPPKEQCTITLQASPAEGGTVSGAGQYDMGSEATITAEANKGYHFVKWQDYEGNTVSKDAKYRFTVEQTADYTAVFEKGEAVTPSQPGGTDQNDSGSGAVKTGDSSHIGLLIALLAASAMGIAAIVIVKKRRSLT